MGCVSPATDQSHIKRKGNTLNDITAAKQEQPNRTNPPPAVLSIPVITQSNKPVLAPPYPLPPPPSQPLKPVPIKQQIIHTKKEIILMSAALKFDANCPMYGSYFTGDDLSFRKKNYNWFSLPIISPIDMKTPTRFCFKNLGIKFNNFVIGIIRQEDLKTLVTMPWKTEGVICYESNITASGSWIRNGDRFKVKAKPVQKDEVVTVVIRDSFIQFWINKQYEGRVALTQPFLEMTCLPYVAVFCVGDVFQVGGECPIKNYYPPM